MEGFMLIGAFVGFLLLLVFLLVWAVRAVIKYKSARIVAGVFVLFVIVFAVSHLDYWGNLEDEWTMTENARYRNFRFAEMPYTMHLLADGTIYGHYEAWMTWRTVYQFGEHRLILKGVPYDYTFRRFGQVLTIRRVLTDTAPRLPHMSTGHGTQITFRRVR